MNPSSPEKPKSYLKALQLGFFQTGAALTDLLTSGIWNRILISDLGIAATPVALLSALKYLLVPLTLWVGYLSDAKPLFGRFRLPYIALGRILVLLGLMILPLSVEEIAQGHAWGWVLAFLSLLISGIGSTASGAPFLALVNDSFPYTQRGAAISIVEIFLIASFALAPALMARYMPQYSPDVFTSLTWGVSLIAGICWLVSLWNSEPRRLSPKETSLKPPTFADFKQQFSMIWGDTQTRRYAVFVAVSAFFAFMQDALLEPFGGDVFQLSVGETTRFNAYWGMGVLLAMIGTAIYTRKWLPHEQTFTTRSGLAIMSIALCLLGLSALLRLESLVRPVLFVFGLGFGLYGIGGYNLLIAVNTDKQAGAYLALWTVIQLLARGAGLFTGGLLRDAGYWMSGTFSFAYALMFTLEAIGILAAIWCLMRVDFSGFAKP